MRALILEHRSACTPLHQCSICQLMTHLKNSLTPEAFAMYTKIVAESAVILDPETFYDNFLIVPFFMLSPRVANQVRNAKLYTIGELRKMTTSQLRRRGLSDTCIRRLRNHLNCKGIRANF